MIVGLFGCLIVVALGIKAAFERWQLPPLMGYIALGWLLRITLMPIPHVSELTSLLIGFLAQVGIVFFLFQVGLETHVKKFIALVGRSGFVGICNILFSGLCAYGVTLLFHLSLIPALFVSVAMTATSIGVSLASWRRIDTEEGQFLLDLVVIDDVLGILLLSILMSVAPVLAGLNDLTLGADLLLVVVKLAGFLVVCALFSEFVEPKLMTWLSRYERMPDSMLSVLAISLLIAAVAEYLGFSLALGAFFAGIAFSRDPKAIRIDASLGPLLDLFVPFFFIGIGYLISLEAAWEMKGFALVLLAAAVVGKVLGTWIPSKMVGMGSLLIALSMVPRAEVALVIMEQGKQLGSWAVSEPLFSAVALVAFATSVITPFSLRWLRRD